MAPNRSPWPAAWPSARPDRLDAAQPVRDAFDTALTLLVVAVLALIVPPFFRWAVLNASVTAANRTECPVDGACWALIIARFHQYIFGLYPVDQYWRVITGGLLLIAGCVPLMLAHSA